MSNDDRSASAIRSAAKRYRDRGNKPPRELIPCGTWQAGKRHEYHGEPVCELCLPPLREYRCKATAKSRAKKAKQTTNKQNGTEHDDANS